MRSVVALGAVALAGLVLPALLTSLIDCNGGGARVEVDRRQLVSAPAPQDRGDLCADVAGVRACWAPAISGADCDGQACLVPQPMPPGPRPAHGWRCGEMGKARVCEDRRRNAGGWQCQGETCTQSHPRMPDDGEWVCVDLNGGVYCHGGQAAAGVAASQPDLGWLCGKRRNGAAEERVCVDLSPDRPPGQGSVKCRFDYSAPKVQHVCVHGDATELGDSCSEAHRCPAGAECVARRCLPRRPSPDCWFDTDCGAQERCRWATCTAEGR